jgi:hypothetical protein
LEIRDNIYRMLLTTPFCTRLASNETSLKFQFSTNILLANKQISAEATRVFLKENDFVILKITGLNLRLQDVPTFKFMAEDQITNPVLRAEVSLPGGRRYNDGTSTLITTPEGLQPFITALWRLNLTGENINNPDPVIQVYPSSLSLSLDFNARALIRREALRNVLLKPWEVLHGIKELTLIGDIGESTRRCLQKCVLDGPFPADAFFRLREYHNMGQKELAQKNFSAAKWWWSLYEDYSRYLGYLQIDPLVKHKFKDATNSLWAELWIKSKKMYFQERLEIAKANIQQAKYEEAVLTVEKARKRRIFPYHLYDGLGVPFLAQFTLCEALAGTALGDIKQGRDSLASATCLLYRSGAFSTTSVMSRMMFDTLQNSMNAELIKLKSPYQCNLISNVKAGYSLAPPARSMEVRSFWEWLDPPEQ